MLKWDLLKRSLRLEGWDYKIKREAMSLLNAVTSFEFIISFIGLYRLLHPLAAISNRLQERGVDIIEAYDNASSVIKDIKAQGRIFDKEFSVIFEQAERVATRVGTQTSVPRIAKNNLTETILKVIVLKIITDEYFQFLSLIN